MKSFFKLLKNFRLVLGIIVFAFPSCNSGDQIDYNLTTYFVYKNNVSENIQIILFDENDNNFDNYLIKPNEEITIKINSEGPKTGIGNPFWIRKDSKYIATKVVIKFIALNKCFSYIKDNGILDVESYDNFNPDMYNKSNNILIYTIDQEELDLATNCQ